MVACHLYQTLATGFNAGVPDLLAPGFGDADRNELGGEGRVDVCFFWQIFESGQFCFKAWIIVLLVNGYFAVKETESPGVLPELNVCRRAREERDSRFDGRFFIGVVTTGIYCRTVCPARMAKEANVHYYPSAAAAQGAGLRPCRRCWPEAAPRLPEWVISSDTLVRALRYIEAGYLNEQGISELASELGVGNRQLSQLFQAELAATADAIAELYRARFARELLESTKLNDQDVAFHAGFGGVDHCDSAMRGIYQKSAKEIHAKHPSISYTCPYRDSLFTTLTVEPRTSAIHVKGCRSSWVGKSPAELGLDMHPGLTNGEEIAPRIRDRDIIRVSD